MPTLHKLKLTVLDTLSNEQSIRLAEIEETKWTYPDAKHAQSVFEFDARDFRFRTERLQEARSLLSTWNMKSRLEQLDGGLERSLTGAELDELLSASLETAKAPPICVHVGEREHLEALFGSAYSAKALKVYSEALATWGDQERQNVLTAIADAAHTTQPEEALSRLEGLRKGLKESDADWARLVGLDLTIEIGKQGALSHLQRWLSCSLPALDMKWRRADATDEVGTTRFFGDPDLPPDMDWPTFGDCTDFFQASDEEVPKASQCRFVAQFDLSDFRELPGLSRLEGVISIFSFSEYDHLGISEVALMHFPTGTPLQRRPHPELDEANARLPERRVVMTPTLSLPESYDGPWSEELKVGDDSGTEAPPSPAERFGALGHTSATTGGDPSPGREWQRLLCIPADDGMVTWHHIAVRRGDLQRGVLNDWRSVWVDLDG